MQPFVINGRGRMVLPSNFLPDLDFTVIDSLDQLEKVIRRDFEAKAPRGSEILRRIETGDHYRTRYELMRDVAEPVVDQPVRHDDVRQAPDPLAGRPPEPG